MSDYEPDAMDEVPETTLSRALEQVRDGTVPGSHDKCLVLLLDTEDTNYNVRSYSCGLTYIETVALLEFHKHVCLNSMTGGDIEERLL